MINCLFVSLQHFCISAAHCFHPKNQTEAIAADNVIVMLGKHDLNKHNEIGSKNFSVIEIILHPYWQPEDKSFNGDIAIVLLSEEVEFTNFIRPVCMPEKASEVSGSGWLAGWGKSQKLQQNEVKWNQFDVNVLSDSECLEKFRNLNQNPSNSSFCGKMRTQGTCEGDAGSGLYFCDHKDSCQWTIRGIVSEPKYSGQEKQCNVNRNQFYTYVAQVIDWIKHIEKTQGALQLDQSK
jgi:hypothetical protein